jgi:outer membrane protein
MKIFLFISIFFGLSLHQGFAQEDTTILNLTLDGVIDLAINQSSAVKYAQNSNVNYYWRYKNFKSRFRPQLVLSGRLPDYRHTTQAITQPDGSVQFKQVSRLAASSSLSLNQSIPILGTNIWAQTTAYGNKNLSQNDLSFSGSPFVIGFSQPLGYNWMKWYKKTEPMIYDEAQKRFVEEIEQISLNATNRYFSYLSVQTNYNLAESNLKNSQNNLKIAEARRALGQISENDFSRVELSVLNAQKSMNQARMDLKNADFSLKSYIGLDQDRKISLEVPLDIHLFEQKQKRTGKKQQIISVD